MVSSPPNQWPKHDGSMAEWVHISVAFKVTFSMRRVAEFFVVIMTSTERLRWRSWESETS